MPGNLRAPKNRQKQSILGGLTEAPVFGSVSVPSVAWQRLTSNRAVSKWLSWKRIKYRGHSNWSDPKDLWLRCTQLRSWRMSQSHPVSKQPTRRSHQQSWRSAAASATSAAARNPSSSLGQALPLQAAQAAALWWGRWSGLPSRSMAPSWYRPHSYHSQLFRCYI